MSAHSLSYLARLYNQQDRFEEAEKYYNRALPVLETSLGPNHPYLVDFLEGMASFHKKVGNVNEASLFAQRAQEVRARIK